MLFFSSVNTWVLCFSFERAELTRMLPVSASIGFRALFRFGIVADLHWSALWSLGCYWVRIRRIALQGFVFHRGIRSI